MFLKVETEPGRSLKRQHFLLVACCGPGRSFCPLLMAGLLEKLGHQLSQPWRGAETMAEMKDIKEINERDEKGQRDGSI